MRKLAFSALLATTMVVGGACKKEDPPPAYPPAPTPVANQPAPYTPAPAAPPPLAGPQALGFPCVSDADLQCPFAHCVSGRCGGCSSAGQCKPNALCALTWFGNACLPMTAASPPVAATPAPAPLPATAPALPAPTPAANTPGSTPDEVRARCVQRTNEFRARVGAAALTRRADHESCEDAQAQSDAASGTAHGAFGRCQESGQNECPRWSGSLDEVVDHCMNMMFAEGPGPFSGHGHYLNLTDTSFHSVSCGVSVTASGEVWIVQDFYR